MSDFYKDMPKDFKKAISIIQKYCQNENCHDFECSECPYPLSVVRCGDKRNNYFDSIEDDCVPEHVKNYGKKSTSYDNKGEPKYKVWF